MFTILIWEIWVNGFEQKLRFESKDGEVLIPEVLIRDYPLVLRIER